jgi:hypothetical protein
MVTRLADPFPVHQSVIYFAEPVILELVVLLAVIVLVALSFVQVIVLELRMEVSLGASLGLVRLLAVLLALSLVVNVLVALSFVLVVMSTLWKGINWDALMGQVLTVWILVAKRASLFEAAPVVHLLVEVSVVLHRYSQ